MQQFSTIDHGKSFDFGKTSDDYAKHRAGPPKSFYNKLNALGVGLPGQKILDLGTGTGVVIRELVKRGVVGAGLDISKEQIETAKALTIDDSLKINFKVGCAEEIPFDDGVFDVVTASQCWWYFNLDKVLPEIERVLVDRGLLVTTHFNFLPKMNPVVQASEALVLKYNPTWTGAGWDCEVPAMPTWAEGKMKLRAMFYYDEPIKFTRESWRGRMRACRGVAASLNSDEVEKFDVEHRLILEKIVAPEFDVIHRIDAHIFEFKS